MAQFTTDIFAQFEFYTEEEPHRMFIGEVVEIVRK